METPFAREPPYSMEAEQGALGAMFGLHEGFIPVAQVEIGLKPCMFYFPAHQRICHAAYELAEEKKGYCDLILLATRLRTLEVLEEIGGISYLQTCMDLVPVGVRAVDYMRQVKQDYELREVIRVSREVAHDAFTTTDPDFLQVVPQRFYDLQPKATEKRTVAQCCDDAMATWERIAAGEQTMTGLPTGFPSIDQVLGGYQPGTFNVVAGRPGQGKTSFESTVCGGLLTAGKAVARVPMDMDMDLLLRRDISREAEVSLPKLNNGYAGGKNKGQVQEAIDRIKSWPMHVLPATTDIRKITSWTRLMKVRYDIQLLTLDYIQLCTADHLRGASEERVISYNCETLKALSQELGIPVMALSQFSRAGEKDNRRPKLSDLRGSGSLEQAAYSVIFLYKATDFDYALASRTYKRTITEDKNRAVICEVAKHQNGGTGEQEMWFRCSYFRLDEAPGNWGIAEDPTKC